MSQNACRDRENKVLEKTSRNEGGKTFFLSDEVVHWIS